MSSLKHDFATVKQDVIWLAPARTCLLLQFPIPVRRRLLAIVSFNFACAGEDLLQASADKPFRFPATFTFVVRSFTVLDGIGKGLDPRFDISEIAAPYARGLLLEGNPQYAALAKDFRRRVGLQVRIGLLFCFVIPSQADLRLEKPFAKL